MPAFAKPSRRLDRLGQRSMSWPLAAESDLECLEDLLAAGVAHGDDHGGRAVGEVARDGPLDLAVRRHGHPGRAGVELALRAAALRFDDQLVGIPLAFSPP